MVLLDLPCHRSDNKGNALWATLAALAMAIGGRNPPDLLDA